MKVLFITSSRLGDAVLSTGVLKHIVQKHPNAKVTIACGGLPSSIFKGVPNLQGILTINKKTWNRHWIKLWVQVVGTRWDLVIDFRDSAVSRLIAAEERYIFSKQIDKSKHKVLQAAELMDLKQNVPAPHIWLTEGQQAKGKELIPDGEGKVLGIGPTANWIGKTWPPENFVKLLHIILGQDGFFDGWRVAVFAAPGEEEGAYQVLKSLPYEKQIDVIAKGSPGDVCGALSRCDYYIGNDSGLMHCAAALGVPTLGLFGPSYPHLYRPWGNHARYVRTPEDFDALINFDGYNPKTLDHSLMTSLRVEDVVDVLIDGAYNPA